MYSGSHSHIYEILCSHSEIKFLSISDCNWTRTHNHLIHKRTLIYLAKMA